MVPPLPAEIPSTLLNADESKGVASEKVVAVPAINANIAIKSITFPQTPSILQPKIGLHASENFCFSQCLTCSIKPKATARAM